MRDQKDAGSNCQRKNDKKPYDGYICAFHDISVNDIGSNVAAIVGGDLSKYKQLITGPASS